MSDNAPHCVYCKYNLTGLDEGTRCPECGLVSLPDALRKEVWHTVDSRARLWGLMARPLTAHPPGWMWALDRPGDVRRSIIHMVPNLALSLCITFAAFMVADSVTLEVIREEQVYDQTDPQARTRYWFRTTSIERMFARSTDSYFESSDPNFRGSYVSMTLRSPAARQTVASRLHWSPGGASPLPGLAAALWVILVWAFVAQVGLWSQLREGLPQFAAPLRTVIAATNLQTCKLVFLAGLIIPCCAGEVIARRAYSCIWPWGYELALAAGTVVLVLAATTVWIGALRSDFTHQLIRSRIHATRIVLMYAVILPLVTVAAVCMAVRMRTLF